MKLEGNSHRDDAIERCERRGRDGGLKERATCAIEDQTRQLSKIFVLLKTTMDQLNIITQRVWTDIRVGRQELTASSFCCDKSYPAKVLAWDWTLWLASGSRARFRSDDDELRHGTFPAELLPLEYADWRSRTEI